MVTEETPLPSAGGHDDWRGVAKRSFPGSGARLSSRGTNALH